MSLHDGETPLVAREPAADDAFPVAPIRVAVPPSARMAGRVALPLLAALLLVGLVFLLPRRQAGMGPTGADVGGPPPLELDEPPTWALQRGTDEVLRCLDRLDWGGSAALDAARRTLQRHHGQLVPEILSRLRALGDDNPVLVSKLLELLGTERSSAPEATDELVRRALSRSALVAKAALRALADAPDPRALDGIRPRLYDNDEDVQSFARGALAGRARHGDAVAQAIILAEVASAPADPDLAYLTVLRDFPDDDQVRELLRTVADKGGGGPRVVALAALLQHDDPQAVDAFDQMLADPSLQVRVDALHAIGAAGKIVGESHWDELARHGALPETLALARVLALSFDTGHTSAVHATELLERIAADPSNLASVDVTGVLYDRQHPWAVELTRQELKSLVGISLGQSCDRVISGPEALKPDFAQLALDRLADESLRPEDRGVLCRMLAHIAPDRSADLVVRYALQQDGATPELANAMRPMLSRLGAAGLARLAREIGTPAGNALFMQDAGELGAGAALPDLQRLILDPSTSLAQRLQGLDTLARLHDGPREETLRAVLAQLDDPALVERGRLLFWNYM